MPGEKQGQPQVVQPQVIQPQVVHPQGHHAQIVQPQSQQPHVVQPPGQQAHVAQPQGHQHQGHQPQVIQPQVVQPLVQPHGHQHQVVQPQGHQAKVVQPPARQHQVVQPPGNQHQQVVPPHSHQAQVAQPPGHHPQVVQPPGHQHQIVQPPGHQAQVIQPLALQSQVRFEDLGVEGQMLPASKSLAKLSEEVVNIVATSTTAIGLKRFAAARTNQAVTPKLLQDHLQSVCSRAVINCGGESGQGEFFQLGAHHLGVEAPDAANSAYPAADEALDLLYVTTAKVELEDLVKAVAKLLAEVWNIKGIASAAPDGTLAGPGLEFALEGYPVKLLLAKRIPGLPEPSSFYTSIPADTAGLVSRKITDAILEAVPDQDVFRQLLRCVRHWAKRRGVYGQSQEFGYIGGVGWAVCCARVCQVERGATLAQLLNSFFIMYSRWDFTCPVELLQADPSLPSTVPPRHEEGKVIVRMPVGSLNATPNVTSTSLKVIQKELRRAARISAKVLTSSASWTQLLSRASFFQSHRHYLELDFMGTSKDVMVPWLAWGRQQLQGLTQLFDCITTCKLVAKPWPVWIPFKDSEWCHATAVFLALRVVDKPPKGEDGGASQRVVIDLREVVVQILERMCNWPEGEQYEGMYDLYIRHARAEEVQQWIGNVQQAKVIKRESGHLTTVQTPGDVNSLVLQSDDQISQDGTMSGTSKGYPGSESLVPYQ
eukprot:TRINITY_DN15856_c0_g1_i3.p1 TRINITY_DN15856_c0_g1~~TRINITY_DN15856_c0_g1_i3.p1  ORF type:complete len:710 (-),score=113.64 TRINITY_DN15856_c0_g1_i3:70-2199(-)